MLNLTIHITKFIFAIFNILTIVYPRIVYLVVLTFKFMTDPLNSVVDGLGILLVGYRIEFSCLYIPQGHYVISS